jgi:hypothetical protein
MQGRFRRRRTRDSRAVPPSHRATNAPVSEPLSRAIAPAALVRGGPAQASSLTPANVLELQRTIGNRAVGRHVVGPGLANGAPTRIQRWGDMAGLYKLGWKYSGGTIATHSGLDPLWHATVFRVDKSGTATKDGLFYNGFHLTMTYGPAGSRIEPHVFFDSSGKYVESATLGHKQTQDYITDVGKTQWAFDLATAKDLSTSVLAKLGPVLGDKQREEMETEQRAKKELAKDKEAVAAAEASAKEARETLKAAAASDESTSIDVLLKDVAFFGGTYKAQFEKFVAGEKTAIKDTKLKLVAEWYVGMRDTTKWIVSEDPKAAYKDWGKTPIKVVWPEYQNCLTQTWRAKASTGLMSEFRMLKFNGYASYKLHPKAKKPPRV